LASIAAYRNGNGYHIPGEYDIDGVALDGDHGADLRVGRRDAAEADIRFVLDKALSVSPYLHQFRDAQDVRTEVRVLQGA
ncbi:hypothetical protein K8I85_05550, partial [bacterium]|nr:hypothetical protein [bacterium]